MVLRFIALVLSFAIPALSAVAQVNPYAGLAQPDAARYKACVAKTAVAPDVARAAAELWLTNDGGVPAKHCLALALIALRRSAEAGQWLEEAARDVAAGAGLGAIGAEGGPAIQVSLLSQAGNAWMLARRYERAHRALTEALAALPTDKDDKRVELFVDRSRASASLGQWQAVVDDLSRAITLDEDQARLYVLRATAQRMLGRLDEADYDIARALAHDRDNAAALLERGNLRRVEGDDAAARRDWNRVADLYPGTEEGETALDNLELMRADP